MADTPKQTDERLLAALPIMITLNKKLAGDSLIPMALRDMACKNYQVMEHAERRLNELLKESS